MPVMNSYSVVVVDQCVDANLLRRSAFFNTLFLQQ